MRSSETLLGESKAMVGLPPEKIPLENFLFSLRKHGLCHLLHPALAAALRSSSARHGGQYCTRTGRSAPSRRTGSFNEEGISGMKESEKGCIATQLAGWRQQARLASLK
jgi:hypothetical protein